LVFVWLKERDDSLNEYIIYYYGERVRERERERVGWGEKQ
jgi:hypothetical protein